MKYIMGFDQTKLLENNISLEQALLLKYFEFYSDKELSYKKMLEDLAILHIQKSQLFRQLSDLETKGFICKSKTKFGFIIKRLQKCNVLITRDCKNAISKPVETLQKCNDYILPTNNNIILFNKYHQGVGNSNILELINIWHTTTNKNISILPSENWERIFDITKLIEELKKCSFGLKMEFHLVVKHYDRIINGDFRDFSKAETKTIKVYERKYTPEELESFYDSIDEIEI